MLCPVKSVTYSEDASPELFDLTAWKENSASEPYAMSAQKCMYALCARLIEPCVDNAGD